MLVTPKTILVMVVGLIMTLVQVIIGSLADVQFYKFHGQDV